MIKVKSETIQWDKIAGTTEYDILINGVKKSSTKTALQAQFALTDGDIVRVVAQPSGEWQEITFDYSVEVDTPPPPPSGGNTFESNTAWARLSNAGFTSIPVNSESELLHALGAIKPKQYIYAASQFSVSSEITLDTPLTDYAIVDVKNTMFKTNSPACIYGRNVGYLAWYGGDYNAPHGRGIDIVHADHLIMEDFYVHDCGDTGFTPYPGFGPISNCSFKGKLVNNGLDLSFDPHAEKGTGIHACNAADQTYDFVNNVLALDVSNQATGGALQLGAPSAKISNITIYMRVKNQGRAIPGWKGYATSQIAGNVIQLWGGGPFSNVICKYLEGDTCMGRMVEDNGIYSTNHTGPQIKVEFARGRNMCISPVLDKNMYAKAKGIVYVDAA
jgi:hypothetical protein